MEASTVTRRRPRPSLLFCLRLLLAGRWWVGSRTLAISLSNVTILLVLASMASSDAAQGLLLAAALPVSGWFTWGLGNALARPIAFLKTLPMSVSPKWVVVAVPCALALVLAIVSVLCFHAPVAGETFILGLLWWSIAVGYGFCGRPLWMMVAVMPFVCWLAFLAVALVSRPDDDWRAAGVALAIAIAGLAFSRETDRRSSGPVKDASRRALGERSRESTTLSRPGRAGPLAIAWRIWKLTTPRWGRYALVLGTTSLSLLSLPPFGFSSTPSLAFIAPVATLMARSNSRASLRFLRTRPFSRRMLMAGTILPFALLVLATTLVGAVGINESLFIGPNAIVFSNRPATPAMLDYLRKVIGAFFLPSRLPASGLSADAWPQLQSLLYKHVFRSTALNLALVCSLCATFIVSEHKMSRTRQWIHATLLTVVVGAALPLLGIDSLRRSIPWSAPPLWLSAGLAGMAMVALCAQHLNGSRA